MQASAYYVWVGVFGVTMLAQFWAHAADSFDVDSGKRLFAQLIPVAKQISAETLAPLTGKERKEFLRLLNKIV